MITNTSSIFPFDGSKSMDAKMLTKGAKSCLMFLLIYLSQCAICIGTILDIPGQKNLSLTKSIVLSTSKWPMA